jgi:hypothetical protein
MRLTIQNINISKQFQLACEFYELFLNTKIKENGDVLCDMNVIKLFLKISQNCIVSDEQ